MINHLQNHFSSIRRPLTILLAWCAGLSACLAAEKATNDLSLQAEIIINRDTYELDPASSGPEFVKQATDPKRRGPLPPPAKVDLTLRISNTGKTDRTLTLGGDESHVVLHLGGTGALNLNPGLATTMEFRMGLPVVIRAGAHHEIPIKSLASGPRNLGQYSYWTQTGEHTLKAAFIAMASGKQLKLETDPVKLKIVDRVRADAAGHEANRLTPEQKLAGWKLLFDGKSLDDWRGYKQKDVPASWEVRDGAIFCNDKPGTDLLTVDEFGDFEFSADWKISEGGNSGIHVRATEATGDTASNSIEVQVIDTSDGWKKVHGYALGAGNSAGAVYGLFPAKSEAIRAAGEWNNVKIRMVGSKLRVEQNGVLICDADMSSDDWKQRLARSKFASMPHFNKAAAGHLALQNYRGAGVWYRNVVLRPINSDAGQK